MHNMTRGKLLLATGLLFVTMAGVKLVASAAVSHFGPWIAIPAIAGLIGIAHLIERRDQREL